MHISEMAFPSTKFFGANGIAVTAANPMMQVAA
jgi:hypothetical protein